MKYTVEKNDCTLTVKFNATAAEWENSLNKAYEQNKGKYNVPGFRKGHVPRRVLENNYGKGLFFEDALYLCAQEYYREFLDKNIDVEPVARPEIDDSSIKADEKGISFAITVDVKPEVVLGEYKGITVKKTKPETVKEKEIEDEIEKVRERSARFVEITDRAVADGDEITLDYCGKIDGEAFEGGTAEKQTLVIGSHTFIPGFEEQIVGMNIGETKDIEVVFPEEYHAEDLKGKQAVFTVTVHEIRVKELPEADDEFAKDVSEYSTLKEYKASIKKTLKEEREKAAADKDENNLIEAVVNNTAFSVPDSMIEQQIDDYIEDFKYQLMYQGLDIENYYKYTDTTPEKLRENYRVRAEKAVRTRLVFEAIVKAENITASDEAVEEKIKEYAAQSGRDFEEFKAALKPEETYYFKNQVITESLLELLKKENTVA